jgi:hypothetical protein
MDSTALLHLFREDTRDVRAPYFWSDAEVLQYMDDAQKMFCRLQGGIADATSAVTQISVAAADVFIPLSPRILKIRAAKRTYDGRDLEILNYEDLQTGGMGDDYGVPTGYTIDESTGDVRAIVTGMEANSARLVKIPDQPLTIALVVYRMPLQDITNTGQPLEIDDHHHVHLLLWMKYLAYRKQDAETFDRERADQCRADFVAYCDQAKAEREKREHKFRTVRYGGY